MPARGWALPFGVLVKLGGHCQRPDNLLELAAISSRCAVDAWIFPLLLSYSPRNWTFALPDG